jgi:type I restriction enzyme S subunit
MKRYNSYKDSGIEWIGEIPSHWKNTRIKFTINEKGSLFIDGDWIESKVITEEGIRYITTGNVKVGHYSEQGNGYISNQTFKELNCTEVYEGDLIISRLNNPIGRACIVPNLNSRIVTSVDNVIYRPDSNINKRYLLHLFSSKEYFEHTELISRGATMQRISRGMLGNLKIPLPDIEEQTAIANYLDQKATQIDNLIAKKERLIQLLEEERTAIINQAVTKGLDPTVPMKDSGIEWLGEIPVHWELWKISHAFNRIGSGTTPESGNPIYHENGTINWLNTGDLNDSEVVSCNKKITEQAIKDYTSLKLFPAGSLVMAMYGATIGKTGIIKFDTTTNQACCVFCKGEIIDLKFLQYWFFAKKENIINLAIGGGQPNISQNILKDIRVNCPEISEQIRIVQYLDSSTKEVDLVISKTNEEIELLKEYKTALISEVVTGKVDLRNENLI